MKTFGKKVQFFASPYGKKGKQEDDQHQEPLEKKAQLIAKLFGKKGKQEDEQSQEPLEKRLVFQHPTTDLCKKGIAFP